MSQCLRCNQPCGASSAFCEDCRLLLRDQLHQGEPLKLSLDAAYQKSHSLEGRAPSSQHGGTDLQAHMPPFVPDPSTPLPFVDEPMDKTPLADRVDHALTKLNDAAQRIASFEPGERKGPRSPRLSPLRDISAEIQRHSTPQPPYMDGEITPFSPSDLEDDELSLDVWNYPDTDMEEGENDQWISQADPLLARHMDSLEAARIENEDIKRVASERAITIPLPRFRSLTNARQRILYFAVASVVVIVLLMAGLLETLTIIRTQAAKTAATVAAGPASLMLYPTAVHYGDTISLNIKQFAPSAHIYATHDVGLPLQTTANPNSSLFQVDQRGSLTLKAIIDQSWEPGEHTITVEDRVSRYTANASFRVAEGTTRPPHLILQTDDLDLGDGIQGANTLVPFTLSNAGGGSISWSATSDQSWLSIAPTHGIFSDKTIINLGGQRGMMKPGVYTAMLNFSSSVGQAAQQVRISMTVKPLPPNAGAVLSIAPPLLSFTATDGEADPAPQALVISNPGSQPLNWRLGGNTPAAGQGSLLSSMNASTNWLIASQTSGKILPKSTATITIVVHSHSLLPSTYTNNLTFSADMGALNSPQNVAVTLTVQPRCSITLGTGALSFVGVIGTANPTPRAVTIIPSANCSGSIPYSVSADQSWVTMAPTQGMTSTNNVANTVIGVNVGSLQPRSQPYNSTVTILAGQSSNTVQVSLTVQGQVGTAPASGTLISSSQPSATFEALQGDNKVQSSTVTITNNGTLPFTWRPDVSMQVINWLIVGGGGEIQPNASSQLKISIDPEDLTPSTYSAVVNILAYDDNNNPVKGSPIPVNVTLTVDKPCTLSQPSLTTVDFGNQIEGGANPAPKTLTISADGKCNWPLKWSASTGASWLGITPASASFTAPGQTATLTVSPSLAGLPVAQQSAKVTISANDALSANQQSTTFTTTMNVVQPCTLTTSNAAITLEVSQGASIADQTLSISGAGGACAYPINWAIQSDSPNWLSVSPASGTDTGSGSTTTVSINSNNLALGLNSGNLTITATANGGAPLVQSPITLPVSIQVDGFAIRGLVNACVDVSCTSAQPLPNATVKLVDSNNTTVATSTSNADGTYSFSNVALGSYSLVVDGKDANNVHYTATLSVTVSGNVNALTINALPS